MAIITTISGVIVEITVTPKGDEDVHITNNLGGEVRVEITPEDPSQEKLVRFVHCETKKTFSEVNGTIESVEVRRMKAFGA